MRYIFQSLPHATFQQFQFQNAPLKKIHTPPLPNESLNAWSPHVRCHSARTRLGAMSTHMQHMVARLCTHAQRQLCVVLLVLLLLLQPNCRWHKRFSEISNGIQWHLTAAKVKAEKVE